MHLHLLTQSALLVLSLPLQLCFAFTIPYNHDICDWDVYDCIYPYGIQFTYKFICTQNHDCPDNFKCCSHRCFRHNICQPRKAITPSTEIPTHSVSHPGQCNILLSCGINLPQIFTERFRCHHDGDCPEHYKCCYIECYHHHVCQPAKNEHPSPITTTEVDITEVFTSETIIEATTIADTEDTKIMTEVNPVSITTNFTTTNTHLYTTSGVSIYITDDEDLSEGSTDGDSVTTTFYENTVTHAEQLTTESSRGDSIENKTAESIPISPATLAPTFNITNAIVETAATRGDDENSITDVKRLTTERSNGEGIGNKTTKIILISTTSLTPISKVTKIYDDEDFIEGSGHDSILHTDQLETDIKVTKESNVTGEYTTQTRPTDSVEFVFETSGDGDENTKGIITNKEGLPGFPSENITDNQKTEVPITYSITNQTIESVQKETPKNIYDDEDLQESSGDNTDI